MRQRELNFCRRLLESRKREILTETERAVGSMNQKTEEAFADPADRATLANLPVLRAYQAHYKPAGRHTTRSASSNRWRSTAAS